MPQCLMFHVVTSGQCWLEVDGAPILLRPGDFALVPRDLRERSESIANVAGRLGYQSAAFSRAFKRHTGSSPGAVRRAQSAE